MISQEFVLIPKENYVEHQAKTTEVLDDSAIEKAKILNLLHRRKSSATPIPDEKTIAQPQSSPLQIEIVERRVLNWLSMMKTWRIQKFKPVLGKNYDSANVSENEEGFLKIRDQETSIEATHFFKLQQPKTALHEPDYGKLLKT